MSAYAHLMKCGLNSVYGCTHSDEMSILFHHGENAFGRKLRKLHSVLAGEASARFSLLLGEPACFDCRISQLPHEEHVVDYFRWRMEDARRNTLNAHCFHLLRREGQSSAKAADSLKGLSEQAKRDLLARKDMAFENLPAWQRRGVGLYWSEHGKTGWSPLAQAEVQATRTKLQIDGDLPAGDGYEEFLLALLRNGRIPLSRQE